MQKLWPNVGRRQMKRQAGQMFIEVRFQAVDIIRINQVEFYYAVQPVMRLVEAC